MFKGTYRYRIDAKGRVPVPAPHRRALGEPARVVVTPLDDCLAAYPLAEWARLEDQLRALPAFSRPAKALTRLLASRAVDCEVDVQGRILVPAALRAAAGLEREVLVVGVLSRFELWDPARWEAFVADSERLLADASLDVQWPLPSRPGETASPARDPQAKPSR